MARFSAEFSDHANFAVREGLGHSWTMATEHRKKGRWCMKETLAKRLVADLMEWPVERATSEFAWLDLMVNCKSDTYQQ